MAYYLVDYENVKADGMYGVDQLGKKDCVCIFYSENASTLTFGLHEKLNQTKGKIVLQKVEVGVKNALDFQLSTYLGYLISENEGKNETYYIVSEDKGLAILTGYWAERGENVKTASDIAAAKEDLEEEKPSKTEKKEKKEKPAENTVTFGDYTLTAPEDWVFDTQEESVFTGNNQQYKAHVIYAYKGAIDKSNPYIALSSFEIVGVGGENFPEECFENQTIGDHTYDVIYNEYPYSLTTFNHSTEVILGIVKFIFGIIISILSMVVLIGTFIWLLTL